MGMNPIANIWVGVDASTAYDIRDQGLIADDFRFDDTYSHPEYICQPEYFEASDELDGYGVRVLHQDWNENNSPVDFKLVLTQLEIAREKMEQLVERHGIPRERVKTYLQTDYT